MIDHQLRQRRSALWALAICGASLLACKAFDKNGSETKPPSSADAAEPAPVLAVLGKAGPAPSRVRVPIQKGAIAPAKAWPDACTLLGEDDIRTILPGATKIDLERGLVRIMNIDEFAAGSKKDEFVRAGRCTYTFQLPGESHPRTRVWIRIEAVADPALIERYFSNYAGAGPYPGSRISNVNDCVLTGLADGNLRCRHGPLIFELGGYGTARFKETEVFGIAPPFFWRDKILPEFAKSIAAKLETSK